MHYYCVISRPLSDWLLVNKVGALRVRLHSTSIGPKLSPSYAMKTNDPLMNDLGFDKDYFKQRFHFKIMGCLLPTLGLSSK